MENDINTNPFNTYTHPLLLSTHSHTPKLQSKNHTNRNQSFKAHRNGIKKPKNHRTKSLKGVRTSISKYLHTHAHSNNITLAHY